MKKENGRTTTKNKNEDFLKELDKARTEKGCEYAVQHVVYYDAKSVLRLVLAAEPLPS